MKKKQEQDQERDRKGRKQNSPRPQGAELAEAVRSLKRRGDAAVGELGRMREAIDSINASKARMTLEQRAGHVFEEFHAGTFNANARKAGDFKTTATTGAKGGFTLDKKVDVRVMREGKVLAEAQAKCCRTSGRTAVEISKPQYQGTQRIVPEGQGATVTEALSRSAKAKATSSNPRMQQIGKARGEAAGKVTEKLSAGGHQSKALSQADAVKMAAGDTSKVSRMLAMETVTSAATAGMKSGALFGGGISAITSTKKLIDGKLTAEEAVTVVAKDAAASAVQSGATAVIAEGAKAIGSRALSKAAAASFSRGPGPMAVAGAVVDIAVDAYNGTLTPKSAAKSATRAAGGWGGAQGGAALGTAIFPGVGTVIGGLAGGILGSMLGGAW